MTTMRTSLILLLAGLACIFGCAKRGGKPEKESTTRSMSSRDRSAPSRPTVQIPKVSAEERKARTMLVDEAHNALGSDRPLSYQIPRGHWMVINLSDHKFKYGQQQVAPTHLTLLVGNQKWQVRLQPGHREVLLSRKTLTPLGSTDSFRGFAVGGKYGIGITHQPDQADTKGFLLWLSYVRVVQ